MTAGEPPAGRARPLSLAAFAAMALAAAGLLLRGQLLAQAPALLVAQAAALAVVLWARASFGRRSFHAGADPTAGGLVTTGPYRFVRHPIYAAATAFAAAGAASRPDAAGAALVLAVAAGATVRMACEERLLAARHPEYREYAARTARVIPYVL